jgi:magnesium transporter
MNIAFYSTTACQPAQLAQVEALPDLLKSEDTVVWVDMVGPDIGDVAIMRDLFHFHPLAIEDTGNQRQRPKVEEYTGYFFSILNPITRVDGDIAFRELDMFVGKNYVVTVHPAAEPAVEEARKRIDEICHVQLMSSGYILYTIVDVVVDSYFPVLDELGDEIEDIGEQIMSNPKPELLQRLFRLKRSFSEMWRVTGQQRDMFGILMRERSEFISHESLRYYMRDVYDHLLRISDSVNTFRDTVNGVVDLYVSSVSNRLNRQVNRLTIITLGIGILGVVTGFYGMNFEHTWPPHDAWWGVPFVLGIIVATLTGIALVVYQNRSDE